MLLGAGDKEVGGDHDTIIKAVLDLAEYGTQLAESRRSHPGDDLTTNLVQAEVDGERLSSAEIASFFILLSGAGNETTRNAMSHGMVALSRYPEARATWWTDFDGVAATAVEEIVRWATPVIFMRRNLTEDIELGGVPMKAGDKVSMWYNSANRDEYEIRQPVAVRRHAKSQSALRITAPAAPTSAWAPTWPAGRSGCCSRSCTTACPISSRRGARDPAVGVHPRHQATAGGLDAAVLTCRARALD